MAAQGKPSILLVDDEPDILFSLQALLRQDFNVHVAEGGPQALELLARHPVQVIMTDQRMPGMTGVEVLWRSHEICPAAIPIVFTGYADIKAVVEAVNRGHIFRYVTKPWDPDDLVALLKEAVARFDDLAERNLLLSDLRGLVAQGVELAASMTGSGENESPRTPPPEMWNQFVSQGKTLLERLDRAASK
jgi:DNA-binding NtrC family response regulator